MSNSNIASVNLILEDNPEKAKAFFNHSMKSGRLFLWTMFEPDARLMVESMVHRFLKQIKLVIYLDDELKTGSGRSFLNWMIDDYPNLIEKVIITSYSPEAQREIREICAENLIPWEDFTDDVARRNLGPKEGGV